jgi:hypothetical protein
VQRVVILWSQRGFIVVKRGNLTPLIVVRRQEWRGYSCFVREKKYWE